MDSELKNIKISSRKVGFFRFGKIDGNYLLTNDFGSYAILTPNQFKNFLEGKLNKENQAYEELRGKGFFKNIPFYQRKELISTYRARKSNLFKSGPSLHIVAVTLRCNFKCIYCQASSRSLKEKKYDMSLDTAKKTVDFIFDTPNPFISIEFQGGEPLVNWPVVKFIVEYAREKSQKTGRNLKIQSVSNLTLMTEKKLEFLIKNKVSICTSLDGPKKIHNKNRPWLGGDSYKTTTDWIKKIKKNRRVGALLTISKYSLKYPKQIIDEYLKWGFQSIHLRPLSYLGYAEAYQDKIGYSVKEFIRFWKESMDYIISINKNGRYFEERESHIMLQKIMTNKNPGYTDLSSPCGAVLGQMLYNYDGNIYTCDEGRMLENDTFLIGNITNKYKDVILNSKTRVMMAASCLENTSCDYCVYKPYCGICPLKNYVYYGNLFPQIENTEHCKIKKAQFNYFFSKMRDKKVEEIFKKWVKKE